MYRLVSIFLCVIASASTLPGYAQAHRVHVTGAMRQTMWQGELDAKLHLDTLTDRAFLYGLGPLEQLQGELLILKGNAYLSRVTGEADMRVTETFASGAPFFVYARIPHWEVHSLPDAVGSMSKLETHLDSLTRTRGRPFAFRLTGIVDTATLHIINVPDGEVIRSPDDAHRHRVYYTLSKQKVEMVGFFSTDHQGIFTHHDTYLHIHLITADKTRMGHLDEVRWSPGSMQLFLPAAE